MGTRARVAAQTLSIPHSSPARVRHLRPHWVAFQQGLAVANRTVLGAGGRKISLYWAKAPSTSRGVCPSGREPAGVHRKATGRGWQGEQAQVRLHVQLSPRGNYNHLTHTLGQHRSSQCVARLAVSRGAQGRDRQLCKRQVHRRGRIRARLLV